MAGPGAGEIRLILDAGKDGMTRFAVRAAPGQKSITAAALLRKLPTLVAQLQLQIERAADREESATKNAPEPVAAGRGRVRNTQTAVKEIER
ncbi:hypothetical protein [Herbiconiux sp. L3-i23]|uniref:hypothetical protein n=1 Tax=Herbiconiux sp. L3-i23 TaxID=2905871 RepID=UPI00206CD482|nr:hypothetical protein [Herbiconiux sp. L3-i23]BDI23546.1 hypothetical protein L3i23_23220 [Herbiconiux sp. L3-i23]